MEIIRGRFAGKRAIVTGASMGIGKAVAVRLAAEGARVGLVARRKPGLEAVGEEIRGAGGEALVLPADCAVEDDVQSAIDRAAEQWGGLDIIVSNAAIELPDEEAPVDREELAVWNRVITTNLTGQFLTCKHGARHLLKAGGGAIVCLGSNLGFLGTAAGEPAYSASKGGIFAMMRDMANDYARSGIRVNMVVPGVIDTPMNDYLMKDTAMLQHWMEPVPAGRVGSADEIASAVLWLASAEASYCIGAALVVDGGMSAV